MATSRMAILFILLLPLLFEFLFICLNCRGNAGEIQRSRVVMIGRLWGRAEVRPGLYGSRVEDTASDGRVGLLMGEIGVWEEGGYA